MKVTNYWYRVIRKFRLLFFYLWYRIHGFLPPLNLRHSVGSKSILAYIAVGQEYFRIFKSLCTLQSTHTGLDVGCGCGRMAVPLTRYLTSSSTYHGFDINPEAILWCKRNISSKFPHFTFDTLDIFNSVYNPQGTSAGDTITFPYPGASFDFVFLTSVFTHILPDVIERYLSEIARVLKQDGICLATFFLTTHMQTSTSLGVLYAIQAPQTVFYTTDRDHPEDILVYNEGYIRTLFAQHSLVIIEPIRYGSWTEKNLSALTLQDVIISKKVRS